MNTITRSLSSRLAIIVALSLLSAGAVFAQNQPGPGNFDPAQQRQRMMDRYREQLEVKDDAEWKIIVERIEKINANRRMGGGFGPPGGFGGGGGRGPGGQGGQGGGGPGGQGGPGGGRFNRPADPEAEALQKAIESKASGEELKATLARLRETRKQTEAKRAQAQEELRALLSVRQEAIAVSMGLLN